MLLAIDIGNSNIVLGIFEKDILICKTRFESNQNRPFDEYAIDIVEFFLNNKIDCLKISGVIVASVVPNLNKIIENAVKKFYSDNLLFIGKQIKPKIKIDLPKAEEVGSDRIVNAVAGYKKYGANLIIIDFGTATTFDIVGNDGQYLGGAISPGVNLAIKALYDMTAQLPKINLKEQKNIIGKDTIQAINSGIYFGYISLIEGMIKKIKAEYKENYQKDMKVIATGGLSNLFAKKIEAIDYNDIDITLEGLEILYKEFVKNN